MPSPPSLELTSPYVSPYAGGGRFSSVVFGLRYWATLEGSGPSSCSVACAAAAAWATMVDGISAMVALGVFCSAMTLCVLSLVVTVRHSSAV